ncbi:PREDICTED: D-xylose-proton symporter-like 2 [Drosophila arizonae]|uniref:D-xylose-proton symporter-like 2 n=1 Tax=Drosophila arizonae TaxID=7263 RepID=A0ABM1P8H2_DROAR|nr:PREDICTED: D-xylose-proton symporter-like 2 [Drosophila arizonae]
MEQKNEYHRTMSQSTVGYSPLPEPSAQESPPRRQILYEQPTSCCIRDMRNQPQANALGAAALIFLSGGMNIAWSIGFDNLADEIVICMPLRISWFIGAIIGSVLGVVFSRCLTYKLLMQLCCLLTIVGGILFTATQLNVDAMMAARFLNGLANGLALPATLSTGGELVVFYKRGTYVSVTEQLSCTLGIFMQIVFSVSWSPDYDLTADQLQGVLCTIYGAIALFLATVFIVESPVQLLIQGEQELAIDALIRLQYPKAVTVETSDQLTEHSSYVAQNNSLRSTEAWCQALPALLRLCLLRALYAMSTSMLIVFTLTLASTSVYGLSSGPYVLFGLLRLAGSCSGAFVQDTLGRKLTQLIGFMICGAASIGLATRFSSADFVRLPDLRKAVWMLLIFQFFAGLGFAPSSVYLSEAFPLSVKRTCIAIAYIVELTIQLAVCYVELNVHTNCIYFYGLGVFTLLGFLFGHWYLPETNYLTLRQAQQKFRDFS